MPTVDESPDSVRPRLGVVAYNPIQYHAPLHQKIAKRGNVDLDVIFLSDIGLRAAVDPGFGLPVAWDIDLISGYAHHFLTAAESPVSLPKRIWSILRWLPSHDTILVNGYNSPWMLLVMAACKVQRIPYLLRASSHPQSQATGFRRILRRIGTRMIVAGCAGGLVMGQLNGDFYRQNRARSVTFAPNSVDTERFARPPEIKRSDLLARWGLKDDRPVILFCGKLIPRKHPLDVAAAIKNLPFEVNTLFVGDGSLAAAVKESLIPGNGVVAGFVNQSDLPCYYHAADVLVLPSEADTWGLVVNEAMACGVLPVVSDRVGCAPNLVTGIGEVFPCGDVPSLAGALGRALARLSDPGIRDQVRQHVERYSIEHTAEGYEQATLKAAGHRRRATAREA